MVAHQHSRHDEALSGAFAQLEPRDAQFDPAGHAPDPRMMGLAVSNQALLDSLRPVAPPSLRGWIVKQTNPVWRHVEYGYTEAAYWLWGRAPWQRWALSGGLGALLGLAIVVVAVPQLRPELELERVVAASSGPLLGSSAAVAASAVVIAPLRQAPPPTAAAVVQVTEPAPAAEKLALAEPDAPTSVEVSEPAADDRAEAVEPKAGKSKKKARHGKRRAKAKNASSLSQLFMNIHRPARAKSAR